jgi:non-specific serine/threonine protein kinase
LGIAVGYSEAHIGRLESNDRRPEVATVSTRFVEALDLEREPLLAARLIELAKTAHAAARSEVTTPPRLTNLPAQLTHFIGRERALDELGKLISDHRLVTLTGAGGVGKTRLACEVGSAQLENFRDGVWLVELAPVSDPAHVPTTVAATFKLSASEGRSYIDVLADHLEAKHTLLILDNCEHLIEACAGLIEHLLRRCPTLNVLATSRETLRVLGEVVYAVPSLDTPSQGDMHLTPERALGYESVRLFVDRASGSDLKFELTAGNVGAVARVCRGLDGIPLALELAAGLMRTMTVGEIVARLDEHRLLPAGGYRTSDPRHETMRRTLDWSYDLLSPHAQRLLIRLTVFVGGWTAEAAEAACAEAGVEVLSLLDQLVHKSLVITSQRDGKTRYRLLEPIRQYADEKLRKTDEWDDMRYRHVAYFVTFAERAEVGLMGYEHGVWLKRLGEDYDNLLAALAWSRDHEQTSDAHVRMVVSLWRYWAHRREYREGATWMDGALRRSTTYPTDQRVKVLTGATISIAISGDRRRAAQLAEECLALSREIGDRLGEACALVALAWRAGLHDPAREVQLHEESVRAFRQTDDLWMAANEIRFLAEVLLYRELDLDRAAELIQEALDLWQKMGSTHGVCIALSNLGDVALRRGQHDQAYAYYEQSLTLATETGYLELIAIFLESLSLADRQRTLALCEQRLVELREANNIKEIAVTLHIMGQMALDAGDYERAGTILEECLSLWRQMGVGTTKAPNVAWTWIEWGHVARYQGDLGLAATRYEEGQNANRVASGIYGVVWVDVYLSFVNLLQGKLTAATEHIRKSLNACLESHDSSFVFGAFTLATMSELARARGQTRFSVLCAGAAAVLMPDKVRVRLRPIDRLDYERVIAAARAQLDDPEFATAWAEGASMTMVQAVEYALENTAYSD